MSRNLERSMARSEYAKFAKRWRHEQRLAGVYGKTGFKRPKFNEWYAIHQRDMEMMKHSTPDDVREYLGADPWSPQAEANLAPVGGEPEGERGVVTLDIATGKEEE